MLLISAFLLLFNNTSFAQASGAERNELIEAPNKAAAIAREDESVLQRLYPFYFAYGKSEIKMQLSFKTPVVKTWPLYLGYTQLMFYVFQQQEKSFQDLTYNPEVFYRLKSAGIAGFKSIDFGIFDHNSNGKPLDQHRSYNDSYLRFNFEREGKRWMTRGSVQVQALYGFETTNTDIQRYIGPLALKVSWTQLFPSFIDKSELTLEATPGGKWADRWGDGGYQASFSFRMGGIHLVPAFYLQYFYGYAESLLNYSARVNAFRAGLIF